MRRIGVALMVVLGLCSFVTSSGEDELVTVGGSMSADFEAGLTDSALFTFAFSFDANVSGKLPIEVGRIFSNGNDNMQNAAVVGLADVNPDPRIVTYDAEKRRFIVSISKGQRYVLQVYALCINKNYRLPSKDSPWVLSKWILKKEIVDSIIRSTPADRQRVLWVSIEGG